jgi:hypothetical protein
VAGFIEWADPCVEVFEVYMVAVVGGCDEYDFVRSCFVCKLSPEHVARVKT